MNPKKTKTHFTEDNQGRSQSEDADVPDETFPCRNSINSDASGKNAVLQGESTEENAASTVTDVAVPAKKSEDKKKKKKTKSWIVWPIKAFFLTLLLSAAFSIISEVIISVSVLIVVYLLLLLLIAINIFFDIIGLAFASCDITPFYSLASKKVKGAKMSLALLKKAEVVSSVCADVIGDICGIISGAAGAAIVVKMALTGSPAEIIVSIVVSSMISALTVGGKAFAKRFAITKSQKIVGAVGKMLSTFSKNK